MILRFIEQFDSRFEIKIKIADLLTSYVNIY